MQKKFEKQAIKSTTPMDGSQVVFLKK